MIDKKGFYVGAPYNFVPFSEKVAEYPVKELPKQNASDAGLMTGEIKYTVTARTPILIDNGANEFYKDHYGRYAIPGSSFRGLIRNNVQILSLSGFEQDIDDYRLMYRNVTSGVEKERYNTILGNATKQIQIGNNQFSISVLENVKAGYLRNDRGTYQIFETVQDGGSHGNMNYYVLNERKLQEEYQRCKESGGSFRYKLFLQEGSRLQHSLDHPFKKEIDEYKRVHYIGVKNKYEPYHVRCSYETAGNDVIAVGAPAEYPKSGYAVSTGPMNEKKAVYIIPEGCFGEEPIVLPERDVRAYEIDLNRREKTLKRFGGREAFALPNPGETRPIFYIEDGGRFYFGYTPHLRLFYDHTIKDGMPDAQRLEVLDFAKALFGFSTDEEALKTRVSFSDAIYTGQEQPLAPCKVILGEPKPSSYMDYLLPKEGEPVTYNTEGFQLRGVKQYWLRRESKYGKIEVDPTKEKVTTQLSPLPKGASFTGKVRFKNLKKEELGLLLWAIRLEKGSEMNIGKAKNLGFGNIAVSVDYVRTLDFSKAYALDFLQLDPMKNEDAAALIRGYQTYMKEMGIDIRKESSVETFLKMKDPTIMPEEKKMEFMSLKEYQKRSLPLPLPEKLFFGKNRKKGGIRRSGRRNQWYG